MTLLYVAITAAIIYLVFVGRSIIRLRSFKAEGQAISAQYDALNQHRAEKIDPLLDSDPDAAAHELRLWFAVADRLHERALRWRQKVGLDRNPAPRPAVPRS